MKIVFEHDGILPVKKYGGIERIIFWHMKELVKRGHQVILIGHPDSEVQDVGVELIPTRKDWHEIVPKDSDVIHLFYNYTAPIEIPTVVTIQGNGKIGEKFPLNTVFVSKKHAHNHGSEVFVYNGIDIDEYPYDDRSDKGWDNFLFLAKGSWSVKNLKHCIKACKRAHKHLHIAGGRSLWPSRYMHNYGMVGGDEKLEIMKKCDALLFPVRWHEPFGIAIIGAMAMGLPVIGSPYGSLPELINLNTGIICKNYSELLDAIQRVSCEFDRNQIRQYVLDHFLIQNFTSSYLDIYKGVITGKSLNITPPEYCLEKEAVEILSF